MKSNIFIHPFLKGSRINSLYPGDMVEVHSCVILTGDSLGESGVKSIGFITGGVAVLTFFVLPCFSLESTNHLNCV